MTLQPFSLLLHVQMFIPRVPFQCFLDTMLEYVRQVHSARHGFICQDLAPVRILECDFHQFDLVIYEFHAQQVDPAVGGFTSLWQLP